MVVTYAIFGRENFLAGTPGKTDTPHRLPRMHFPPMDMACSESRAMSGSGAVTGFIPGGALPLHATIRWVLRTVRPK
ncbi:MAG: hypothetical protein QOJ99_1053 [Bryobacterales bacterium]|nr:hypothetical protein [Bryobacterales bacterium]